MVTTLIDVELVPLEAVAHLMTDEIIETVTKCQLELQEALSSLYEAGILVRIKYNLVH